MIQLISVDLFETLVDLSGDRHVFWQKFLGENALPEQTEQAWSHTGQLIYKTLDEINAAGAYKPLHSIFKECFSTAFKHFKISHDPETAARHVIDYHARRPWFPEAKSWLKEIENHFLICLSSDTDYAMMGDHIRGYPFNRHFTSEDLGCYKGDAQNRFFKSLLNFYTLKPNQILHIGDSPEEMTAAKRMGLQTCWVNRNQRCWTKSVRPDFEVSSLDQVTKICL